MLCQRSRWRAAISCAVPRRSKLGKVLVAIRDAESRTRFLGYRVEHYKLAVFTLSAVLAGVAGALYVPQVGIINPSEFAPANSIEVVIWVAVGGRGTLAGAALGALIVNAGKTWFTGAIPEFWLFALGGLFVLVTLFLPKGILGTAMEQFGRRRGPSVPRRRRSTPSRRVPQSGGVAMQQTITPSLLYLDNVTVSFDGFRALNALSLAIDHAEMRAIIGPNGAGKTTMMDVITGKTRSDGGRRAVRGHARSRRGSTKPRSRNSASGGNSRRRRSSTCTPSRTICSSPSRRTGASSRSFVARKTRHERERIDALLERIRLKDHRHRKASELSHGQKQWLEIGMLLAQDPKLLLVDEPAAGMTDQETADTADLLREIAQSRSVVVVEHDMTFVRDLDVKVTVLHEGSVLAEGTLDAVSANERVIEVYLGR